MTGHGLGEDGFVRPAAYNTGAAQLWTPPEAGLQLSSTCSLWAAPAASPYLIKEGRCAGVGGCRALRSYLGLEEPGRRKTMVLRGFVRGGKEFPPSSGSPDAEERTVGRPLAPATLIWGFRSHGLWHQGCLVSGCALLPTPTSASLSLPAQGNHCPKGNTARQ